MKKHYFLAFILSLALCKPFGIATAATNPPGGIQSIVGTWGGSIEFGKMKYRLILNIKQEGEGRIVGTMDVPDQGAKGLPVSAILFNPPSIRLELDAFGGALNAKLDGSGTNLIGTIDVAPRPMDVTFRKVDPAELKEPERLYTFKPGEKKDFRGYWKGKMQMGPSSTRINLKVGRMPDGKFDAKLDLLDFGAQDVPAGSSTVSNAVLVLEWPLFQATLRGELDASGNRLATDARQGGKSVKLDLERIEKPEEVLAANLSFTPKQESEDIAGFWKGTLDMPGAKLRLAFKIGRTADNVYAASLKSLDQGPQEIPASKITLNGAEAKLEWQALNGTFTGKLEDGGKQMKGEWKQGNTTPLVLRRTTLEQLEK